MKYKLLFLLILIDWFWLQFIPRRLFYQIKLDFLTHHNWLWLCCISRPSSLPVLFHSIKLTIFQNSSWDDSFFLNSYSCLLLILIFILSNIHSFHLLHYPLSHPPQPYPCPILYHLTLPHKISFLFLLTFQAIISLLLSTPCPCQCFCIHFNSAVSPSVSFLDSWV